MLARSLVCSLTVPRCFFTAFASTLGLIPPLFSSVLRKTEATITNYLQGKTFRGFVLYCSSAVILLQVGSTDFILSLSFPAQKAKLHLTNEFSSH